MNAQLRATCIGSISIFLWGTLALLTALTEGRIPALQLMAMTFAIAFALMCLRWWRQGHSGIRHLRQPPLAWLIGVGAYSGYHFCYFEAMRRAPAAEVSTSSAPSAINAGGVSPMGDPFAMLPPIVPAART